MCVDFDWNLKHKIKMRSSRTLFIYYHVQYALFQLFLNCYFLLPISHYLPFVVHRTNATLCSFFLTCHCTKHSGVENLSSDLSNNSAVWCKQAKCDRIFSPQYMKSFWHCENIVCVCYCCIYHCHKTTNLHKIYYQHLLTIRWLMYCIWGGRGQFWHLCSAYDQNTHTRTQTYTNTHTHALCWAYRGRKPKNTLQTY